ncbi:hypothetical protein [Paenibacillus sp. NFR01]|uniref:hypothetical protein n=1 Tax=Paenibacillus sp. NFR01 TaxID=1566279 RepID=UPI0008B7B47D|nr:hypothetical protein [Paenibacillus sp. NFR01]SET55329.1 hypothetical protein SAMN03159358_2005 [Paenibacillus sp. NFR01]
MRKILSRIGIGLLILIIAGIVVCFYIGELTYAFSLLLLLLFVFGAMGQLYKLKNDEYMYHKLNEREQYEDYTR